MFLLLVNALLCTLAVGAVLSGGDGLTECRKTQKGLTALEVLPGGGWDNLRNLDRGRVMNLSYSQCRTTEDGLYLIPDQVYVVPLKRTSIDIVSEVIRDWRDYRSSTSASINSEVSFLPILNGKFSADSERVKTHQVRDSSVTTRIQVRDLMYQVKAQANFQLDQGFKEQLILIGNYLENNQSRAARYHSELLVRDYGTHVLTGVHAGANLVQEDQVRSSFVSDSWSHKSSITTSAGVTFFQTVNVGLGVHYESTDQFSKQYLGNRTHSRIESNGGIPFYPGVTLQKWQQEVGNQLVAIDRSGQPLNLVVSPASVPELPEPTVRKVSQAIESAISLYYTVNTHPGCLDPSSPNFNFRANLDDGSCRDSGINFTFGGLYQECFPLSGDDSHSLCQRLEQRNPLTGSFSCPPGYLATPLHTGVQEEAYSHYECQRHCHTCWLVARCCNNVCGDAYHVRRAQFKAFWCAAGSPLGQPSGYLFGGLYSADGAGNPLTNNRGCPPSFYPLTLLQELRVCVSDDTELALRYSAPFGGFFSCETGNPLAGPPDHGLGPDLHAEKANLSYPKRCPAGYSQHRAAISDSCQVLYCLKSGALDGMNLPRINLPPFSPPPLLTVGSTNTVVVLSDHQQQPWFRDSRTNLWKTAPASGVRRIFPETTSTGGGAAAAISVSVTLVAVGLIGLAYYYGRKRWRNHGYQPLERSPVISHSETVEEQDTEQQCPQDQSDQV
ncbi:macrophage-expressed gene 1 protein-like [Mustelus asterias]